MVGKNITRNVIRSLEIMLGISILIGGPYYVIGNGSSISSVPNPENIELRYQSTNSVYANINRNDDNKSEFHQALLYPDPSGGG